MRTSTTAFIIIVGLALMSSADGERRHINTWIKMFKSFSLYFLFLFLLFFIASPSISSNLNETDRVQNNVQNSSTIFNENNNASNDHVEATSMNVNASRQTIDEQRTIKDDLEYIRHILNLVSQSDEDDDSDDDHQSMESSSFVDRTHSIMNSYNVD
jgi:predicted PurR-regulated permease PerM